MAFPLYNKQELLESPSQEDGLDAAVQKRLRNSYCDLIQGAGAELKLPQYVVACAIFLCHHFFAVKSMRRNDRFLVATACLYLGSKMEDRPKNVKDVITACFVKRFGSDSERVRRLKDAEHMQAVREMVFDAEKVVLLETGFNFIVDLPYHHALTFLDSLPLDRVSDEQKLKLTQTVWDLINDSLRTTLLLEYSPAAIAAGMVGLAVTVSKEMCDTGAIWEDVKEGHTVEKDIRKQMLDLYDLSSGRARGSEVSRDHSQNYMDHSQNYAEQSQSQTRPSWNDDLDRS
ncbi:unnamed protein product [Ostreobium quekettii]|uniref:Cyclin-like domain-containing protein n=1 Tax=Ostreobium quekettii TaxID=121088 RepID=A0A8S1IU07_9CHLO|nr:unnamed protein product [Ostreobium quekettii]|eukprot:evm.model.scf_1582.2 EVM.evm.TU.scf_1582.2   scf_1582:14069-16820(-)